MRRSRELQGVELSIHLVRSAQALRAKGFPFRAEAFAAVMLLTYSPW